jgi:hypothetical protein
MSKLNKKLKSKYLFIAGIVSFITAFLIGGIIGSGLELIGFIAITMAILALNKELKDRKKQKENNKE